MPTEQIVYWRTQTHVFLEAGAVQAPTTIYASCPPIGVPWYGKWTSPTFWRANFLSLPNAECPMVPILTKLHGTTLHSTRVLTFSTGRALHPLIIMWPYWQTLRFKTWRTDTCISEQTHTKCVNTFMICRKLRAIWPDLTGAHSHITL